jgi:AraC family transcriptional regulator
MPEPSKRGSPGGLASGRGQEWLGNSLWRAPKANICWVKSWRAITAVSYHRDGGETIWRGDRPRLVLTLEEVPTALLQVENGPVWQSARNAPGVLGFYPAGVTVRVVHPAARFVQLIWDMNFYSSLLPELEGATSRFEFLFPLHDPLLSQIIKTLAQEVKDGFGDKILVENLGTILCVRLAQRFVGHLPLPTSRGLSPERLRRVRNYIEEHLDDNLSLTILADFACLSPYHFSRSFKQAAGVGLHRYVIQRRLQRAKRLLRQTHLPLALIAQEAGFADQSHLTLVFRREMGVTPGRYRSAMA